jgi:hypothetical protein
MKSSYRCGTSLSLALCCLAGSLLSTTADAADYPPIEKVTEGFKQVTSRSPSGEMLCNIWTREKDAQMLIELPKDFASKKYFIALTVGSGDTYAGLQANDYYVYWRQYDDRLALIQPNMDIRSTGEAESKASVSRLFTDSVLLDIPIVTMVPRGGPVIDADALLVGQASKLFGGQIRVSNTKITKIVQAKAFAKNIEVAFEIVGAGGKLQNIHYSLSEVETNSGYKPRVADQRIGYFTTGYTDLGIYDDEKTRTRFINRWHLEKADPSLKLSPPKEPITFYIEHTTPIRYRRWVKQGIEYWNKAFEEIGISDAIVVQYQDAKTGRNMDLDPEDVQYNFVRWLNNNIGTAIGPSRVNPMTGQILDADIVLTDGWIRYFNFQFNDLMPEIATQGMSQDTLTWLSQNPNWDPRVRFADPANRLSISQEIMTRAMRPNGGHPIMDASSAMMGDQMYDGLVGRTSQVNGYCLAATGKQLDMASARIAFSALNLFGDEDEDGDDKSDKKDSEKKDSDSSDDDDDASDEDASDEDAGKDDDDDEKDSDGDDKEEKKKYKGDMLDGMPDSFVGPLLADLVAHEVGHTLGLRHNFKGSSCYTLAEINSEAFKGNKTMSSTVMDYVGVNIPYQVGETQGDWAMIGVGPYDYWAIEYGYTTDEKRLEEILKQNTKPEYQYATDEDTSGPDPLARRYDFSKNPLEYAENQIRLVKLYRERLIEKFVKDGDPWDKARRGYELTLGEQMKAISMISNWIGGASISRAKKGDPGDTKPITPIDAEYQRKCLEFVVTNAFRDDAYGLTTEILERVPASKWIDDGFSSFGDSTFPVHDRILGIQASALTMIMNPTQLRRIFDNEQLVPADTDALTLPELLSTVSDEVWSELTSEVDGEPSARKPRISSLRRNLQLEHLERLVDLALDSPSTAALKPVQSLAAMELRQLKEKIGKAVKQGEKAFDPYSLAHLTGAEIAIDKALDASYIRNIPNSFGGGGGISFSLGQPATQPVRTKTK